MFAGPDLYRNTFEQKHPTWDAILAPIMLARQVIGTIDNPFFDDNLHEG